MSFWEDLFCLFKIVAFCLFVCTSIWVIWIILQNGSMAWNGTALLSRERCFSMEFAIRVDRQTDKDLNKMALYPPSPTSNFTLHNSSQCKSVTEMACTTIAPKQLPAETRAKAQFVLFWLLLVHSCLYPSYLSTASPHDPQVWSAHPAISPLARSGSAPGALRPWLTGPACFPWFPARGLFPTLGSRIC